MPESFPGHRYNYYDDVGYDGKCLAFVVRDTNVSKHVVNILHIFE